MSVSIGLAFEAYAELTIELISQTSIAPDTRTLDYLRVRVCNTCANIVVVNVKDVDISTLIVDSYENDS